MNIMATEQGELQVQLQAAIEAREDGDYEDSALALEGLLARFPDEVGVAIEYARTLDRLGQHDVADALLTDRISVHPDNIALYRAWAQLPTRVNDFAEVVRRGGAFRARFALENDSPEWAGLSTEFDALYESAQWDRLAHSLDENWDIVRHNRHVLASGLVACGKLFQPLRTRMLIETASAPAWGNLHPTAMANLSVQARLAIENQKLLRQSGYHIVSLGQNCLPYQLLGRWGFASARATAEALTPFDLGGFSGDRTADILSRGFESLSDPNDFVVESAWGGGLMLSHRPTGLTFFHQRGPYWLGDRPKFFRHLGRMISNWDIVRSTKRRIFVFCLCGGGDLDILVNAVIEHLLAPDDHLVVLDVLSNPHVVPQHDRLTYVHMPYPQDYDWTDFGHQVSDRGLRFELGLVRPITTLLERLVPQDDVTRVAGASRRNLLDALAQEASGREAHEIADALRRMMPLREQDETAAVLGHAEAARRAGQPREADDLLKHAIARMPEDAALRKAWIELPTHAADWTEALQRSRALRQERQTALADPFRFSLGIEVRALYELRRWDEVVPFIRLNWNDFTSHGELFTDAVDVLSNLFERACLSSLLEQASPAAASTLSSETILNLGRQIAIADDNAALLRKTGTRVIPLGQDMTSFLLTGRWGLLPSNAVFDSLTPFDVGGFSADSAASVITDGFSAFLNRDAYDIVPTWFGGFMPVHRATGVNFFAFRRPRWSDADSNQFLSMLFRMVENWKRAKLHSRKIFSFFITDDAKASSISKAFVDHLADDDSYLIIVNLTDHNEVDSNHSNIIHLKAAPPVGYQRHRPSQCASDQVFAFEAGLASSITEVLLRDR